MQEKLLQGIQGMDYPSEAAESGLEEEEIIDRPALKEACGGYRQKIMDRFCKVE